jgi:glycosyltransferase involved in cell wall biosynthesis
VVFNNREANVVFSYGGEISEIIHRMGVPLEHIVEIGSAVDDSWIASQPLPQQGVRRFIFVGRYEARKGLQDLRRCREALGTLPVEFHFVGAIPEHMRLSMPNCTYHGEVRDAALLRSLLDSAQVLVAPSRSEGMPNVILEAMARGLAIIATEVGAVPAMVSGLNGVRIPPARPAALRQALRTFAHMPQPELDALRKESIRIADTCFRWSLVAVATLAAIKERTHAVPRT